MIKGIGVDICHLERLKDLDSLAKRILHDNEYQVFLSKKTPFCLSMNRKMLNFVA